MRKKIVLQLTGFLGHPADLQFFACSERLYRDHMSSEG